MKLVANPQTQANVKQLLDSVFNPGKSGRDRIFTKQRCVNILGRDVACVQDSAAIQPSPYVLFGGLLLLLWVLK